MIGGVVSAMQGRADLRAAARSGAVLLAQAVVMPGPQTRKSRPRLWVCELKSAMRVPLPKSIVRQYSTSLERLHVLDEDVGAVEDALERDRRRSSVNQRFSHCWLMIGRVEDVEGVRVPDDRALDGQDREDALRIDALEAGAAASR